MSLESNKGTVYYAISCGVPSSPSVDIESNLYTGYYHLSANDYIIYGQPVFYPDTESNLGTYYVLKQCDVPSDGGLDLESNKGTAYYYSSAFNCVGFC